MKRAMILFGIHPAGRAVFGLTFLAIGIGNAVFLAGIDAAFDLLPEADGADTALSDPLALPLALTVGRPWIGLLVGVAAGLCVFALEKRRMRAALTDPANLAGLAVLFQLPRREQSRQRAEYWRPFKHSNYRWSVICGILILLVAACLFAFSLKTALCGLGVAMAITYPEQLRLYEGVLARLTNPLMVGEESAAHWLHARRRAGKLVALSAEFSACVLILFGCKLILLLADIGDGAF